MDTPTPTDTQVVDTIAVLLGTREDWNGDVITAVADIIGQVRPHPGDTDAGDYLDALRHATGRTVTQIPAV